MVLHYGVMDRDDLYRRKAAEAQRWADRAVSPDDKAHWLRLVEGWLSLIQKRPQTAAEDFADAVEARGTKQEDSTKSH